MDRLEGLSGAEQQAEQLAEEERYYSLYKNEVEEEMYKGELEILLLLLPVTSTFHFF